VGQRGCDTRSRRVPAVLGLLGDRPRGITAERGNPYGLLDIAGNVWEWCEGWYHGKHYEVSLARDPKGPPSGQTHVVRGGSWDSRPDVLSCSRRNFGRIGYREGDLGFRAVMDL